MLTTGLDDSTAANPPNPPPAPRVDEAPKTGADAAGCSCSEDRLRQILVAKTPIFRAFSNAMHIHLLESLLEPNMASMQSIIGVSRNLRRQWVTLLTFSEAVVSVMAPKLKTSSKRL